jgi:hypothetical protein
VVVLTDTKSLDHSESFLRLPEKSLGPLKKSLGHSETILDKSESSLVSHLTQKEVTTDYTDGDRFSRIGKIKNPYLYPC